MFRKSKLASVAAAAAIVSMGAIGTAQALVRVDQSGTGEVIVIPYYNVNQAFQTNLSITNTSSASTIVKVRFRESGRSQDLLDFNIYMSPNDVWTGTVRNIDGDANLLSVDTSCTFPPNNVEVSGVGTLNSTGWTFKDIYDDVDQADTREGYIEIYEVGDINPNLRTTGGDRRIVDIGDPLIVPGITHVSGAPANCGVVSQALGTTPDCSTSNVGLVGDLSRSWCSSYTYVDLIDVDPDLGIDDLQVRSIAGHALVVEGAGLNRPDGGLYANAIYLDVSRGSAYVTEGVQIDGCYLDAQHFRPDDPENFLLPSLASCDSLVSSRFLKGAANEFETALWGGSQTWDAGLNDANQQTPKSGNNPGPISHVLSQDAVLNDYFVDPNFTGRTDWVVTFPMRKHGIYDGTFTGSCLDLTGISLLPLSGDSDAASVCFAQTEAHVAISVVAFDREEQSVAPTGPDVSPVLPGGGAVLQREVNVIAFDESAAEQSVLGSDNASFVDTGTNFAHGWARISFESSQYFFSNLNPLITDFLALDPEIVIDAIGEIENLQVNPVTMITGVPVIGFAAIRGDNDVESSYGETFLHRYEYKTR